MVILPEISSRCGNKPWQSYAQIKRKYIFFFDKILRGNYISHMLDLTFSNYTGTFISSKVNLSNQIWSELKVPSLQDNKCIDDLVGWPQQFVMLHGVVQFSTVTAPRSAVQYGDCTAL